MKLTWKSALALLLYLAMLTAMAEGTGVLTLPAGLKTIEEEAFHGDTSVASVVIPEGTAEIGPHAFAHSSLTEITLPASVKAIADDAFEGCENPTATVAENSYAHTRCVEIGVAVDVIECKHTPNENCVCTVCGAEAHTPGEDCVCAFCGTEAHALDENCVCAGCGETMHEMKAFGDISEPCHACVNCDYETHQMVDHDFYIQNAVSYT